jgi:hypothetical protein
MRWWKPTGKLGMSELFLGQFYEVVGWHMPLWPIGKAGRKIPLCLSRGSWFIVLNIEDFNTVVLCELGVFSCYRNHATENGLLHE